jgi:hypothetical protein
MPAMTTYAPESLVSVDGRVLIVLSHIPRDDVYLLETRDGFRTRRYYGAGEIVRVAPCSDRRCPCETGEPCTFRA